MRKATLLAYIALYASVSMAYAAQAPEDCARLPQIVIKAALRDFPNSHVVTRDDLFGDDREIWSKSHGSQCPGWAAGTFRPGSHQYAVSIVQSSAVGLEQALVLVDALHVERQPLVLVPMQTVARASVVRRMPAGKSKVDAVVFEALEAGYTVFSWDGSKFQSEIPEE
jgi:hypothetical protein